MKLCICAFCMLLLFSFLKTNKEVPSKIYYKNTSYIHFWAYNTGDDPYPDTAIYLNTYENPFNFQGPTKTITIYFDHQFTIPAVSIILEKADKVIYYKRFDRKGNLRMQYTQKNSEYQGQYLSWYSNGNVLNKWLYENGKLLSSTNYYFTGELKTSALHYNSKTFKAQNFCKNGRLESEWFWQIPNVDNKDQQSKHSPKFKIEYDSIDGFPSLYYLKDSNYVEMLDDGSEVVYIVSQKLSVDSVVLLKK